MVIRFKKRRRFSGFRTAWGCESVCVQLRVRKNSIPGPLNEKKKRRRRREGEEDCLTAAFSAWYLTGENIAQECTKIGQESLVIELKKRRRFSGFRTAWVGESVSVQLRVRKSSVPGPWSEKKKTRKRRGRRKFGKRNNGRIKEKWQKIRKGREWGRRWRRDDDKDDDEGERLNINNN